MNTNGPVVEREVPKVHRILGEQDKSIQELQSVIESLEISLKTVLSQPCSKAGCEKSLPKQIPLSVADRVACVHLSINEATQRLQDIIVRLEV